MLQRPACDLPPPTLPLAFYFSSLVPCSFSVQYRSLAGLWACLCSVTRQQLCRDGYQDNAICVTLWLTEMRGGREGEGWGEMGCGKRGWWWWWGGLMRRRGERRLDRKDGGEGVTNIERCIWCLLTPLARCCRVVNNHTDTWCFGWGQVSEERTHNEKPFLRLGKLEAADTLSPCLLTLFGRGISDMEGHIIKVAGLISPVIFACVRVCVRCWSCLFVLTLWQYPPSKVKLKLF